MTPSDRSISAPPTLRRATSADAPSIAAMHTASRATTYRGMLPDDYLDRVLPGLCLAEWRAKLASGVGDAREVLVAESGGEAVGFTCVSAPDADGSSYLDNLHARPDRKGGGLGTLMLDAATQWARGRGARRMHLLVLEGNVAAAGFYEARGWHLAGRRDDDEMDGHPISSLVYARVLD